MALRLYVLAMLAGCAMASAQAAGDADPARARAQIEQQRQSLLTQLQQQEAACYQRFAVEDCLKQVRATARERDNQLWRQDLELREVERRDQAAQRLQAIEARESQRLEPAEPSSPGPRQAPGHDAALRQQQASARAQHTRQRQAEHAAAQQQRSQEQAERLEQARQRYEQRQEAARQRRVDREQRRAQDAAQGRVPSAPLPAFLPVPAPTPSSGPQ